MAVYIMPHPKAFQLQSRWACFRGLFTSAVSSVTVKPNASGAAFPMASKDRLIMYHLIINESVQCRDGSRIALHHLEAKIMHLSNILKLFVLCPISFAFHQVSCTKKGKKKPKQNKTTQQPVKAASIMLGPVEVFVQPLLPLWWRSGYWGPKSLITGVFSAVNTNKTPLTQQCCLR